MAPMTLDEALLWLNDRLGKSVALSVEVDRGGLPTGLLEGAGILGHWSEAIDKRALAFPRDDLAGAYGVGEIRLDLTELADCPIRRGEDREELEVELCEGVVLRIIV